MFSDSLLTEIVFYFALVLVSLSNNVFCYTSTGLYLYGLYKYISHFCLLYTY